MKPRETGWYWVWTDDGEEPEVAHWRSDNVSEQFTVGRGWIEGEVTAFYGPLTPLRRSQSIPFGDEKCTS